uniref:Protein CASP n=1 Tax=Echinococcus granulosus TaxID=6210 RepID=A0A068WG96_ECHGR|nr:cut homeobox 1b [Echinococcus granulosus]
MLSIVNSTKSAWNEFQFPKFQVFCSPIEYDLQVEIGEIASTIASVQERDRFSRKKLVDALLQFRNSVPEEVRKAAASVLKSFQTEVDRLTIRSQKAEDAFIQVYQCLAEMPDPSLALAEVESISKEAQCASDLKIENARLRETIEGLKRGLYVGKSEASPSDAEPPLRKDEEEEGIVEAEDAEEKKRKGRDAQAEERWKERERKLQALLDEANNRSSEAEAQVKYLFDALKDAESHAFDLETDLKELKAANSQQVQTLLDELEKANDTIVALEEARAAEADAEKIKEGTHPSNCKETTELQNRIEELESELEAKTAEVDKLKSQLQEMETQFKAEIANLHERLESTNSALVSANESLASAQAELRGKYDYDEIKRELEVLRSIEFQHQDGDPLAMMDEPLEFRLLRKTDQLQNRIASISSERDRIESKLMALQKTNADMAEREAQQKALIARLEEDLNRASTWHHQKRANTSSYVGNGDEVVESASPLTDLLIYEQEEKSIAAESSILDIVQNQRDRLREQNRELEENLLAMRQQLITSQTEVESLRQDNVKLYEKIRFVQAYSPSTSSSLDRDDAVLARYSSAYEERLNPFRQFGQQERQRRYQALLPHEKIMHNLGRIIISNRGARLATFAYVLVMHLLVFLVLYKMVTATDPVCPSVHGSKDGRPDQ